MKPWSSTRFALSLISFVLATLVALSLGTGVFACGICIGLMMPALSAISGEGTPVMPRPFADVVAWANVELSKNVAEQARPERRAAGLIQSLPSCSSLLP